MILTFETTANGESLDIHFDEAGRDRLIELLSACRAEGDHEHMFMMPEAGENSQITCARFDKESIAAGDVTLWLLPSGAEPAALERTESHRIRNGKIERVQYVGGVEQSAHIDENVTEAVAAWKEERRKSMYEKLFDAGCVKFGEFKLKSGIMSPVYCDLRMLVSAPAVLAEIGQALGAKAREIGCDRVAGIPYGGVPIAVAASIASGIPMIYPRKEVKDHGTRNAIEGTYNAGEKVLVIDDLVTSGLSFAEAVEPLKAAGLIVTDVLVILDREQGGAKVIEKAGYKLHSLGTLSGMVDALVASGKIEPEMRAKVAEFIAANQFA